jgi:hypothetical protein
MRLQEPQLEAASAAAKEHTAQASIFGTARSTVVFVYQLGTFLSV